MTEIDEQARLAEVRAEMRAAQRREQDAFRRLGSAVVSREETAPIHAELRAIREEAEGLAAATLILDF